MAQVNSGVGNVRNVEVAERPTISAQMSSSPDEIPPEYQLRIDVRNDSTLVGSDGRSIFPITAPLPERYNLSLSSDWSMPFASHNAAEAAGAYAEARGKSQRYQGAVKAGVNLASQASGISTRVKSQSMHVWEGSSPISMSFDLIFHAKTNSVQDVRDKHMALWKMTAPTELPGGQALRAPGPTLKDQAAGMFGLFDEYSRRISLQIGTYLYFDNVIVRSVGADIETLCGADGIPISMSINVEFATFYGTFTVQDIEKAFKGAA